MENNTVTLTDTEIRTLLSLLQSESARVTLRKSMQNVDETKRKAYMDKLCGISRNLYHVLITNERHENPWNHEWD